VKFEEVPISSKAAALQLVSGADHPFKAWPIASLPTTVSALYAACREQEYHSMKDQGMAESDIENRLRDYIGKTEPAHILRTSWGFLRASSWAAPEGPYAVDQVEIFVDKALNSEHSNAFSAAFISLLGDYLSKFDLIEIGDENKYPICDISIMYTTSEKTDALEQIGTLLTELFANDMFDKLVAMACSDDVANHSNGQLLFRSSELGH
jgi:hypothetical protein